MLALGSGALVIDAARAEAPTLKDIMQRKLDHAQKVLEGIALADFGIIEREADLLYRLSEASAWTVLSTPEYLRLSGAFRDTAGALKDEAKARNLDAAVLAYMEMTTGCVQCHKYLRGARLALGPDAAPAIRR
jgi:hypothetical protein